MLTGKRCLRSLQVNLHQGKSHDRVEIPVGKVVIAGWTGRDPVALEKHIAELEALGVKRPASTPIFYRVSSTRLTTEDAIDVSGGASSGEAEFLLLKTQGKLWVGVGSDHTDRDAETYNVTVSKQMCEKPIAADFWAYEEIASHWDQMILRSYAWDDGERVPYQEGTVAGMRSPDDLLARYGEPMEDGTLMFCGTLAAIGGIRPSGRFEFRIEDPVLGRKIAHGYDIISLPVLG